MATDPRIFAEAEERVTELVAELERIKGASGQVEAAESTLTSAVQRIHELSGTTTELSKQLKILGGNLQGLRPELIASQLQELLDLEGEAREGRRGGASLLKLTFVLAAISAIAAIIAAIKLF